MRKENRVRLRFDEDDEDEVSWVKIADGAYIALMEDDGSKCNNW